MDHGNRLMCGRAPMQATQMHQAAEVDKNTGGWGATTTGPDVTPPPPPPLSVKTWGFGFGFGSGPLHRIAQLSDAGRRLYAQGAPPGP